MRRLLPLIALMLLVPPAIAIAAPSGADLAARMRAVRLTPGFEARFQIVTIAPDGQRSEPIKLAVIGRFDTTRQQLLIRGIAPESIRNETRLAEYRSGCVRALDQQGVVDPLAPLFETGLLIWDMFAPWWDWPQQSLAGKDLVAGRECTLIRSRNDTAPGPIREVRSCVDTEAGLSLRTQFFDSQGARVRSVTVVTTLRKDSGLLAAKKVTITTRNQIFEAEVYSGDEHYDVPIATFETLEGSATCR